ncbi:M23 family metallopeptidase [Patescibacteria group bacterium]
MLKHFFLSTIILCLIILAGCAQEQPAPELEPIESVDLTTLSLPSPTETQEDALIEPVEEFEQRISLKPFGIYITPKNSPVQPEKFSGYHTGVDVEFTDREDEIPVRAIADGEVIEARAVSGYGGLTAIKHTIDDQEIIVIYAHLDPTSLPTVGSQVTAGEVIGRLGEGNTAETDFERKHLHLGFLKKDSLDVRGYVNSESELDQWIDPLTLF